jgi:hypothetical protein
MVQSMETKVQILNAGKSGYNENLQKKGILIIYKLVFWSYRIDPKFSFSMKEAMHQYMKEHYQF